MSDNSGLITLRGGHQAQEALVPTIMAALKKLLYGEDMNAGVAVIDLIWFCRGGEPVVGRSLEVLQKHELLAEDGSLPDSVKAVVLAAVVGNDYNLRLDSPYRIG